MKILNRIPSLIIHGIDICILALNTSDNLFKWRQKVDQLEVSLCEEDFRSSAYLTLIKILLLVFYFIENRLNCFVCIRRYTSSYLCFQREYCSFLNWVFFSFFLSIDAISMTNKSFTLKTYGTHVNVNIIRSLQWDLMQPSSFNWTQNNYFKIIFCKRYIYRWLMHFKVSFFLSTWMQEVKLLLVQPCWF